MAILINPALTLALLWKVGCWQLSCWTFWHCILPVCNSFHWMSFSLMPTSSLLYLLSGLVCGPPDELTRALQLVQPDLAWSRVTKPHDDSVRSFIWSDLYSLWFLINIISDSVADLSASLPPFTCCSCFFPPLAADFPMLLRLHVVN